MTLAVLGGEERAEPNALRTVGDVMTAPHGLECAQALLAGACPRNAGVSAPAMPGQARAALGIRTS
jgi:hypothetical protein